MKVLYLLRHAKSDWGSASIKDLDRPLNARGNNAADAIGKELRNRRFKIDRVLASPAVRVRQTLERVVAAYGSPFDIREVPAIYLAEPRALLDLIKKQPDEVSRVMMVGHNPGMQELVVALSAPGELRDEAIEKFPTAAFSEIRFDVKDWNDIRQGDGILECLVRPRDL